MGKIVAVGGGELGLRETWEIDRYIASLSPEKNPKLLFIPTASHDTESYIRVVSEVYGEFGCQTEALCLEKRSYSQNETEGMILSSDIIYVGGGDTEYMMDTWKQHGVDRLLKKAWQRNIVLSGLSAGSDCWFIAGYADSEFLQGKENPRFKWVKGLGFLPFLHTPHYNDPERKGFDEFLKGQAADAIALDNNTAFVSIDGSYSVFRARPDMHAYYFQNDGTDVVRSLIE